MNQYLKKINKKYLHISIAIIIILLLLPLLISEIREQNTSETNEIKPSLKITKEDLSEVLEKKEKEKDTKLKEYKLKVNNQEVKIFKDISKIQFAYPSNWNYSTDYKEKTINENYRYNVIFKRGKEKQLVLHVSNLKELYSSAERKNYITNRLKEIKGDKAIKFTGSGQKENKQIDAFYFNFYSQEKDNILFNSEIILIENEFVYRMHFSDKEINTSKINEVISKTLRSVEIGDY